VTDIALAGASAPAARRRRTDADLAASLLTAIHARPHLEWTTRLAVQALNGIDRYRARTALAALATAGHLTRHELVDSRNGFHRRRTYRLNTAKDSR
jgi:hypothetical protein